jgi:hypothetical protein
MYLVKPGQKVPESGLRVQLLGSGTILRESFFAQNCWKRTGASLPTSGAARRSTN